VPEAFGCKLGDTADGAVLKKLVKLRQELNDLTAQLDAAE